MSALAGLEKLGAFLLGDASLWFVSVVGFLMTLYMAAVFTQEHLADRSANRLARTLGNGRALLAGARRRTSAWFVLAAYAALGSMVVGVADVLTAVMDLRAPVRYLFLFMLFALMRAASSARRMRRESRGEK